MWISVRVAGIAMPTRISNGMMVQSTSTLVFSWKCADSSRLERRCANIDQNMTANTSTPMITQIQKMVMCRSNTERLTSVTPDRMFTSQAAWACANSDHSPIPIQTRGCRDIAGSPYGSCYPADRSSGRSVEQALAPTA